MIVSPHQESREGQARVLRKAPLTGSLTNDVRVCAETVESEVGLSPLALSDAVWEAREAPADGERRRRPLDGLPRLGVFAGGEFDHETAVEFLGAFPRGGVEMADCGIRGSAAQSHLPSPESQRKHEARSWSDAPFPVSLDEEVPAIGGQLEAVLPDGAGLGARAGVVEPQFAGRTVELGHEPIRENPTEGQGGARHDDAHLE